MSLVLTLALLAAAAEPVPTLTVHMAPRPATRGDSQVAQVEVTLRFDGIAVARGKPMLRIPRIVSNVDTVATVVAVPQARDARGPLSLTARDIDLPVVAAGDAEAGGPAREWFADRATMGPLTVRYTVPAQASLPPRGAAPPFAFSNDGGGVSAAGHVFLLLPPGNARYRTTVTWDLSSLPPGARALSSYGPGRATAPELLDAGELGMAFYMAGNGVGQWPAVGAANGFFAGWQGKPPFDAAKLMQWTGTLYGRYVAFFGQQHPAPYGVFLRYNPINAGGGVGLYHSFVATFGRAGGAGSDPLELQLTLAHEMFHTFQPYIENPAGLASSWFGEGLATLYQRRLPLRFGLITPAQFLKDLNFHTGRYSTSVMATVPNEEVPRRFWADTRIRTLPYDRGMLYFAGVDRAMRAASAGRRSLDDLVMAMLARQRRGQVTGNADWEAELQAALGPSAVAEFHAFLAGQLTMPPSDAFGPCFQRVTRKLRRYELGFDPAVLVEPERIVRGLISGSTAAAAGLRDGDRILVPVPQDALQGTQGQTLTLSVRRGDRDLAITYLPRGETVDAWQWTRVAGVPDTACAL